MPYFDARDGAARAGPRAARPLVAADPLQVALTTSTTDGCNIVLAGLGLGPADEIVTTTASTSACSARSRSPARGSSSSSPSRTRSAPPSRRGRACSRSRRCSGRPGGSCPCASCGRRPGFPCSSTAPSRSARSRSTPPGSTSSRSRARSGSAGRTRPAPSSSPTRSGFAVAGAELLLAGRATSRTAASSRGPGAARFDPSWWPASSLAGLLAALDSRPDWAFEHAAAVAERCRALLAAARRGRRPRERALDARRLPRPRRPGRARRVALRAGRARPRDPGRPG